MPQLSLSSLINPNPCSEGAERSNWQNLQQILEILEQFFIINISEDNRTYTLNIENVENIVVNNFDMGDLVVNSITAINYYGPYGEYCPEYCHCIWDGCPDPYSLPEMLCYEISNAHADCTEVPNSEGTLFRTNSECEDGLIWDIPSDETPPEICCECEPPACCGCADTPMSGTSIISLTLSGALTGTFQLAREDLAGGECASWFGTINPTGACSSEFSAVQVILTCTATAENPVQIEITGGGAACAFNQDTLTLVETTCLLPGLYSQWTIKTLDILAGGTPPCGCGEDIVFTFTEQEPP